MSIPPRPSPLKQPELPPHDKGDMIQMLISMFAGAVGAVGLVGVVFACGIGIALVGVIVFFIIKSLPAWLIWPCFVGAAWGIYAHLTYKPPPQVIEPEPEIHRQEGVFGNGGFAYWREMTAKDVLCVDHDHGRAFDGIYLQAFMNAYGTRREMEQLYYITEYNGIQYESFLHMSYRGEGHVITIAPARSGKGTGAIIPTLAMIMQSLFILDVKGENWFICHKSQQRRGYKIILLNPFQMWGKELGYGPLDHTTRFNPFSRLDPNASDFATNVRNMAVMLIQEAEGVNKYFTDRATDFVACLIAYLTSDADLIANGMNTLPGLRKILGMKLTDLSAFMETAADRSKLPMVQNLALTYTKEKGEEAKELNSTIRTANTALSFLDDERVAYFLSGGDFQFKQLREPKTAVYFIIPLKELTAYSGLVRLIVECCLNDLQQTPAPEDSKVTVILDEVYQLGELPSLKKASGVMAGLNCRLWSIFQDMGQMKTTYGKDWETICANAGALQILGVNDMTTAEYLSKRIGKSTITLTSFTESYNTGIGADGKASSGHSTAWATSMQAGDAVSPQKLMELSTSKRGLVFITGEPHPALTTNIGYHETYGYTDKDGNQRLAPLLALPAPVFQPQEDLLPNATLPKLQAAGIAAAIAWKAEKASLPHDETGRLCFAPAAPLLVEAPEVAQVRLATEEAQAAGRLFCPLPAHAEADGWKEAA